MQLLVLIIILQFVVILWLAYPRIKPKAVDAWEKARQVTSRIEKSEHDQWTEEFNLAQGITAKNGQLGNAHSLVSVRRKVEFGVESLEWKCTCGHKSESYSSEGLEINFAAHVKIFKEAEKYNK